MPLFPSRFLFSIQDGNDAGYFSVRLHSGIVSLNHSLNESKHILTLVGQNSEFSCHRGRVLLRVTAILTNVTLQNFSLALINENATVGEGMAQAVVNDDASVKYSMKEGAGSNLFNIDKSSGLVTVAGNLDFETESSYNLTIIAKSKIHKLLLCSAILMIRVLDVNESPFFTNSCVLMCQLFIKENAPNFTEVGTLKFEDPDLESVLNGQVIVTINSVQPQANFSIMQSQGTATIVANEVFDRETISNYSLSIQITDKGLIPLFSTLLLSITVVDINDNAPEFISFPNTLFLREGWPVHTLITQYNCSDRDIGSNAQINYSIFSIDNNSIPFVISTDSGALTLSTPLDFEVIKGYNISVIASNPDGLSTESLTSIYVEDDNDNSPIFNESSYNASLNENSSVGMFVLFIRAEDADSGLHGVIDFSLLSVGNINNSFEIARTGNLTLSDKVDREEISVFNLTVAATDRGVPPLTSFATVLVWIDDANDNPPIFDQALYNASVSESDSVGKFIILIKATDADSGLHGIFDFTLLSEGNLNNSFQITTTGNITLSNIIDYEQSNVFNLTVTATDRGVPPLTSFVTVIVRVEDINDNAPVFKQSLYNASVSEDESIGTFVVEVKATDADSEFFATINYTLLAGNTDNSFEINQAGNISLSNVLDREQISLFNISVAATDRGTPPFSSVTTVIVRVEDINDNAPIFKQSIYNASVSENASLGTFIVKVEAEDADSGVLASTINYTLWSGNTNNSFEITQSGNIFLFNLIDREQISLFNLTVAATDRGTPPLTSFVTVKVRVEDINDNAPVFKQSLYNTSASEDDSIGTFVVKVEATDADSWDQAIVDFSLLVDGSFNNSFQISNLGNLTLSTTIDREHNSLYNLTVVATDRGTPPLTSFATVIVTVKDINDNPPIFNRQLYNSSVSEGASLGRVVVPVEATDADSGLNAIFYFELLSEGNYNNAFNITRNGNIILSNGIDREQISMYSLTVTAADMGEPPFTSSAMISITVEDINDNPPIFIPVNQIFYISENADPMEIVNVSATDNDSPLSLNSRITFSLDIMEVFENTFNLTQVDNSNAVLALTEYLDFETLNLYMFQVVATDHGSPRLSSTITIIVNVTDIVEEVVITRNTTVKIQESAPLGFRFARLTFSTYSSNVSILDTSSSENSNISRSILFRIERVGTDYFVAVNKLLDFETSQNFTVTVLSNNESIIYLTVIIIDVNELPPVFETPGNFSVEEEQSSGTILGEVIAKDGDTGPLSGVTYSIVQNTTTASLFSIDASTGEISTTRVLDREQLQDQNLFLPSSGSIETISIIATDLVTPYYSAVISIHIQLVDINDNDPIIQTSNMSITVRENQPVSELVHTVVATDRDIGPNGQISFTLHGLESSPLPFAISSAGIIRTTVVLDAENVSSFTLLVAAYDSGNPQRNSSVTLVVEVLDLNDNIPFFTQSYSLFIPENAPIGSTLPVLEAVDYDRDKRNSYISFRIISHNPPNAQGLFNITSNGPNSSIISITRQLDFETLSLYRLVVEAIDNGMPSLSSRANVTINVLDVDETPPRFFDACMASIRENVSPIGMTVTQCTAIDIRDGSDTLTFGVLLTYNIIMGNVNDTFTIDNTGIILLQRPVDRETIASYELSISATDPGGLTAYQEVTIFIIDDNDNPPIITNPNSTVIVSASDILNNVTHFFTLLATDADIGMNAELIFSAPSFRIKANTTFTVVNIAVSNTGGAFLQSTIVTLELEAPCLLQSHEMNPSSGQLTSLFLCNVSVIPDDIIVTITDSLELSCLTLSNFVPEQYLFFHDGALISNSSRSIVIENVTLSNSGQYTCGANAGFGIVQSSIGIVRVQGKAIIFLDHSIIVLCYIVPPLIVLFPSNLSVLGYI